VPRRFSDFLIVCSFFTSNNCSRSVLAKNWRLCTAVAACACKNNMRLAASRILCLCRLAASCIQIVPGWPPVACNMNGRNLPATGGHSSTICMQRLPKGREMVYNTKTKQTKINFGSNRNKPKQDLFRVCFGLFREKKFGLFRCFEPISKQPKQTDLFRNKPKQH
jgi:hypothetical protein